MNYWPKTHLGGHYVHCKTFFPMKVMVCQCHNGAHVWLYAIKWWESTGKRREEYDILEKPGLQKEKVQGEKPMLGQELLRHHSANSFEGWSTLHCCHYQLIPWPMQSVRMIDVSSTEKIQVYASNAQLSVGPGPTVRIALRSVTTHSSDGNANLANGDCSIGVRAQIFTCKRDPNILPTMLPNTSALSKL